MECVWDVEEAHETPAFDSAPMVAAKAAHGSTGPSCALGCLRYIMRRRRGASG